MCPPPSERRPIPWEGFFHARDRRHRRTDPAVGVHPLTAFRLGDGWARVDRSVSSTRVPNHSPRRLFLEPRRCLGLARAARRGVCRGDLGNDGGPLHDSLPPGPLRDSDAVGGVGVVGRVADGVVLLGGSREVSHSARRLGVGSAQAQRADRVGHAERSGHIAARHARCDVAPPRRALAGVLPADRMVRRGSDDLHVHAAADDE